MEPIVQPYGTTPTFSNDMNFYNYIAKLWEYSALARLKINDVAAQNTHKNLEDWFEVQKMRADAVFSFIEKETATHIDMNFELISQITGGIQFAYIADNMDNSKWATIKKTLEQNERLLFIGESKAGLTMRRKVKKGMDEYQQ